MRRFSIISLGLVGFSMSTVPLLFADDNTSSNSQPSQSQQNGQRVPFTVYHGPQSSKSNVRMNSQTWRDPGSSAEALTADEAAILATAESYGVAFSQADAK